jgi:hypothetical protein
MRTFAQLFHNYNDDNYKGDGDMSDSLLILHITFSLKEYIVISFLTSYLPFE